MLTIPNYFPANDLPPETKRHIASHNDIPEKIKWMRVNKGWEAALKDERLWEEAGKKLSSFALFKTITASTDPVNSLLSLDLCQRNLKLIPHEWRIAVDKKFKELCPFFFKNLNKKTYKEDVKEYSDSFIKGQLIKQVVDGFFISRIEVDDENSMTRKLEKFIFDGFRVRFNDELTVEVFSLCNSSRVEDLNKLDEINKAVDALLVWECLSQTIPNNTFDANMDSYNSIDELLKKSRLLKKWCKANQADLLNINTLNLSTLKKYEIHSLPEVIWEFLPNLQYLYADNLKLTSLPTSIGFCTKLRSLDLSANCLVSLPESFSLLNLKYLLLNHNRFNSLPTCILELKKLKRLYIGNNYLSSLHEDISKCKQLVDLDASGNYLSKLPDSIVELKHLKALHVQQNHLHSLPDNIFELKALTSLNVSSNHLSVLPNSILKLQHLQKLDISNNDGNFTGVYLPDGYQSTNLADIEVIADKIPALTNPICTIQ